MFKRDFKNASFSGMGMGSVSMGYQIHKLPAPNSGDRPGCALCEAGSRPWPIRVGLQNSPAKIGDTSLIHEAIVKRLGSHLFRKIGHDVTDWAPSLNPIFNSLALCSCSNKDCSLLFGIKQYKNTYTLFSMKAPNYYNVGIAEIEFKSETNLDSFEERLKELLGQNRDQLMKIPQSAFCKKFQNLL